MACVAAICVALGSSACGAKDSDAPLETTATRLDTLPAIDRWADLASPAPSDMAGVGGETFGLADWRMPTSAGQSQGLFGVAELGGECIVAVGPGILSDPSSYTVMVETRRSDEIIDPRIAYSVAEIQSVIDSHRAVCA